MHRGDKRQDPAQSLRGTFPPFSLVFIISLTCCTRYSPGVLVNERIVSFSLNGHHLALDPFSPIGTEEAAVGDFTASE